jgi:putative transport protein
MRWLGDALRANPELALFLVLALGYAAGRVRFGNFELGPIIGTLIAGLAVGQLEIPVSDAMKRAFFLMFLFAVGFKTGPEFFRSLRSQGVPQLVLTVSFCVVALASTWVIARALGMDTGTTAGLLAGAQTNSTALGAASAATRDLGVDSTAAALMAANVASAYALTYPLGAILMVRFLPFMGPWLMRVNLKQVSREFERASGESPTASLNLAVREIAVRGYKVPPAFDGRTVADVERQWPSQLRAVIARVRRGDTIVDAAATMPLRTGDVVAVAGRPEAIVGRSNPLDDQEVNDRELLAIPAVSAILVLTNRALAGQPLATLAQLVGARGIFLITLRRAGRELPFTPSTIIERGDELRVSGSQAEVARVAAEVGYAVYPSPSTDLLLVAAAIAVGGLIGLPALSVSGLRLSLSVTVGVLLAGLTLGYLRSIHARFSGIPEASVWLLQTLGLSAFLALIGLQAGPSIVESLKTFGVSLLASAAVITLLPPVVTILVGHYVVGMNPALLMGLCAGAGTSAAGLAAVEQTANSKVPALGYGLSYAVGNVLMALWGTLIVLAGGA